MFYLKLIGLIVFVLWAALWGVLTYTESKKVRRMRPESGPDQDWWAYNQKR